MRLGGLIALIVLVLAFAGCGGAKRATTSRRRAALPANPFPADASVWARATTSAQRSSLAVLARDIEDMRAAALKTTRSSLKGTPALRRTTDRFLRDLNRSPVDLVSQNRIIDHAAAAVAASCEQCFQQLMSCPGRL